MNDKLKFIPKADDSKNNYWPDLRWRSFTEARKYARSLKLKSEEEWHQFNKGEIPDDIPKAPHSTYHKDWKGWKYWLGKS